MGSASQRGGEEAHADKSEGQMYSLSSHSITAIGRSFTRCRTSEKATRAL